MIAPISGQEEINGAPKSYWNKKKIIAVAHAAGANHDAIDTLNKLPADDVLAICLRPAGYYLCGSSKDPSKRSKTMYWRVDIDFIKSLGGSCFEL